MAILGTISFIWNLTLIIQLLFGLTKRVVSVLIGLSIIMGIVTIPLAIGIGYLIMIGGNSIDSVTQGIHVWILTSLILAGYLTYYLFNVKTPTKTSER